MPDAAISIASSVVCMHIKSNVQYCSNSFRIDVCTLHTLEQKIDIHKIALVTI